MSMLLNATIKPVSRQLLIIAALSSILLTWLHLISQNPFNLDGILYLHAAEVYLEHGFKAALTVYGWPFFSIFIAWLSHVTHLSLEHAAYLLNTGLQILIVVNFILITAQLGGSRWHCHLATVIILLYPYFNNLRALIVRDFGYWAFALLALLWLLKYAQTKRLRYAIAWALAMLIASLFRIEGLVFLVAAPGIFFFSNTVWRERIRLAVSSSLPLLLLSIIALYYLHRHSLTTSSFSASRLSEIFLELKQGLHLITANLQHASIMAKTHVLSVEAADSSFIFLIGGLISTLLATFIQTLTPIYTGLCAYGMATQSFAERNDRTILLGFIAINLLIIDMFLGQRLFVDKRYLVFLALICLLWLPTTLVNLLSSLKYYQGRWSSKKYLILFSLVALLGAAIGGVVPFGYSKAYITHAGKWLASHTPAEIKLYSNSPQILYYAAKPHSNWQNPVHASAALTPLLNGHWHQYDYLAIKINHHDAITAQQLLHIVKLQPVQTFGNTHQDQVFIFSTH